MRDTKTDMARVIVQALRNLPTLPAADNVHVVRMVARNKTATLARQHQMAVNALSARCSG